MKKQLIDYVSIHNAIKAQDTITQLNKAIQDTHTIDNSYNKETAMDTYKRVFGALRWDNTTKLYVLDNNTTLDELTTQFITDTYINLTKGLVHTMAVGVIKKVNKQGTISYLPHSTYKAAAQIVNSGYNDQIFEDLTQEVFITLWENRDSIKYNENTCTFDISGLTLECYRTIRRYLYNNKTKIDNTTIDIIDYDENNDECITMAVNTLDYRRYAITNYNNECNTYNELLTICGLVLDYIRIHEKSFICDKCKIVLTGLLKGMSNKEISKNYNISINSITKYRNILNNAYYEVFKKPLIKANLPNSCYTSYYPSNGKISIDFTHIATAPNTITFKDFYNNVFTSNIDTHDIFNHIDKTSHIEDIVTNYINNGYIPCYEWLAPIYKDIMNTEL